MKKFLLLLLLTNPLFANHWSLSDTSDGWNTSELVRLYYHNSDLQSEWSLKALSHYQFSGNEKILDFGCGDGKLSALLTFFVPNGNVTGVDISKHMLDFASKKFSIDNYPNLNFKLSETIHFEQSTCVEKFDLITSFCVMHLVPSARTVLRNLNHLLKDDGKLVMTFPIGSNLDFFKAADEEMKIRGWSFPSYTEEVKEMRHLEKVRNVFKDSGFHLEYIQVVTTKYPFSTKKELTDWFEGTLSGNWNLPHEGRREFFEDLTDRYLQYRPSDLGDGGFVYFTLDRIDLVASKI